MFVLWWLGCGDPTMIRHEIKTSRTFRDNDPRKSDVTITGLDAAGCDLSFDTASHFPGPTPAHTIACSDKHFDGGLCTYYCEITGPL